MFVPLQADYGAPEVLEGLVGPPRLRNPLTALRVDKLSSCLLLLFLPNKELGMQITPEALIILLLLAFTVGLVLGVSLTKPGPGKDDGLL